MVHHRHQIIDIPTGASIAEHSKKTFSLQNFCKVYFSAFAKWCRLKKPSSPSSTCFRSQHSSSPKAPTSSESRSESTPPQSAHEEIVEEEEEEEEEEENTMKGARSRRRNNSPSTHKSMENSFTRIPCLSRNGSRRRTASPSPSFMYRSNSRGSTDSNHGISPTPSLSRGASKKNSANPIMFSNSMGLVKPPPLLKHLECTLEELCFGCKKKIKVTRDVLTNSGQIVEEEEMLTIDVKAGWKKGTKITFEGMGNEIPGRLPADITFVIAEKPHPLFQRVGDDLEITIEIPLVKALTGCDISIPLLGGNDLSLGIEDVIQPGYEKIMEGHGMPSSKHQGKRGNLKVIFLVKFPADLTQDQRLQVHSILQDSS